MSCSNHSCILEKPKGMGTNGRCGCLDKLDKTSKREVKRVICDLRNEIQVMKDKYES